GTVLLRVRVLVPVFCQAKAGWRVGSVTGRQRGALQSWTRGSAPPSSWRTASRPDRASHATRSGAAGLRPRQSSEFHKLRHCIAARTRGASILSYRRARDRRSILPLASEPYVARLLGLPGYGGVDPFLSV